VRQRVGCGRIPLLSPEGSMLTILALMKEADSDGKDTG
jgi:hypothetical protein